jgi:hypothetical protein
MGLLLVIVLGLVGLGLVAFAIVAMRDEPPRWMLRFKRPGRILVLGLVVLLAALIVNIYRYDINEEVADFVGHPVSCHEVGELEIEGDNRQVYACIAPQDHDRHIGCFAQIGDSVADVSSRVAVSPAFAGKNNPNC